MVSLDTVFTVSDTMQTMPEASMDAAVQQWTIRHMTGTLGVRWIAV